MIPVSSGWKVALVLLTPAIFTTIQAQEPQLTSDRAEIVHVLNRITFGPRPGDIEAVQKMGLQNYIQQQLHPENIDDTLTDQAVGQFDMMQMSTQELADMYVAERKMRLEKKREQAAANQVEDAAKQNAGKSAAVTQDGAPVMASPAMAAAAAPSPTAPETAMPVAAPQPGSAPLAKDRMAGVIDRINQNKTVCGIQQLEQAKLVRAIDSNRQLQEVLADFWDNHFNVDVKKAECRVLAIPADRDSIRPHIWGRFRDLLEASAKSPAMLIYLDNATNTIERTMSPFEQEMRAKYMEKISGATPAAAGTDTAAPPAPKKAGGINENYAREIMELHTLGVDGGYTQKDVQEVARCFTGWSFDRQTGAFRFAPRQHDNGEKVVLGHHIDANGGIQDGETVMDILCASPATAHHIATEMCERFVSDTPSPALVDRIAGVFTSTDGDLRKVTEAILASPEFLSPESYGNKIKSPLEFAASAIRASGSTIVPKDPAPYDKIRGAMEGAAILGRAQATDRLSASKRQSLNWHIYKLGEPLFACTPPTGYKEVSTNWVSPGALIERLNFSMALTQQEVSDIRFDANKMLAGIDLDKPQAVLDQCVATLLPNNITDTTRKVLTEAAVPPPGDSKTVNPAKLIALILGSPEFQRK